MKKKTILISVLSIILLSTTSATAQAQTHWTYTYDASGNRTQRTVTNGSAARQTSTGTGIHLIADEKVKAVLGGRYGQLKIETLGSTGADITVYELSGRLVTSKHATSEITTVDLSTLRRGTYILTIELDGEKKSCKFNK